MLTKETLKKHSKTLGILLGLIGGIPLGIEISIEPSSRPYNLEVLLIIILLGVLGPPFFLKINTYFKYHIKYPLKFVTFSEINPYIDINFTVISGCLSSGVVGLFLFFKSGGEIGSLTTLVFFTSVGIGFLLASLIDNVSGYRHKVKRDRK